MTKREYKMRTTKDQMDSAIVTLSGLLDLRRIIDESIENLMGADLALNSKGECDEIISGSKLCVHRAKELILEVSELISECLDGNI